MSFICSCSHDYLVFWRWCKFYSTFRESKRKTFMLIHWNVNIPFKTIFRLTKVKIFRLNQVKSQKCSLHCHRQRIDYFESKLLNHTSLNQVFIYFFLLFLSLLNSFKVLLKFNWVKNSFTRQTSFHKLQHLEKFNLLLLSPFIKLITQHENNFSSFKLG